MPHNLSRIKHRRVSGPDNRCARNDIDPARGHVERATERPPTRKVYGADADAPFGRKRRDYIRRKLRRALTAAAEHSLRRLTAHLEITFRQLLADESPYTIGCGFPGPEIFGLRLAFCADAP